MSTIDLSVIERHIEAFFANPNDEACRVFHGRGHCYSGLDFITIDWFKPVVWVVIFKEEEEAIFNAIALLMASFAEKSDVITAVIIQFRSKTYSKQRIVYGDVPSSVFANELGLRYQLQLEDNQNIGFFMDARPARQWLKGVADGKNVLNLFSYTCAFSIVALTAGARQVVNIDMAKSAIAKGQKNHSLNGLEGNKGIFLSHDIFRSIKKLSYYGPYDCVVIDPPSHQRGSFVAQKDYAKLLRKIAPLMAKECEIVACLNAPYLDDVFLTDTMKAMLPDFTYRGRLPNRSDFPETDSKKSLKMYVYSR